MKLLLIWLILTAAQNSYCKTSLPKDPKTKTKKCDLKITVVDDSKYSEDGIYESQSLANYITAVLVGDRSLDKKKMKAKAIIEKYFGSISQEDKKQVSKKIYSVILTQRDCIDPKDFEELVQLSNAG